MTLVRSLRTRRGDMSSNSTIMHMQKKYSAVFQLSNATPCTCSLVLPTGNVQKVPPPHTLVLGPEIWALYHSVATMYSQQSITKMLVERSFAFIPYTTKWNSLTTTNHIIAGQCTKSAITSNSAIYVHVQSA